MDRSCLRRLAVLAMIAVLTACAAPGHAGNPGHSVDADTSVSPVRSAAAIHDSALTLCTHTDWPGRQMSTPEFDPGARHEPGAPGSGQWDLPRMKEGGLDAIFMSIFTSQRERTPEGRAVARERALEQIRITEEMVARNPEAAEIARTPDDAHRLERAGKRAIFMGMENGYPIGTDLANLAVFHEKGIRYITLAHSRNNDICDSSTDEEPLWNGLSPFGEEVVREMNRLGILVDVSHVDDNTVRDVLRITRAPILASHSSARAICDHPRNLPDELLRAIRDNDGVVQVCLVGSFLKAMPPNPEREAALDAIRDDLEKAWQGELEGDEAKSVREAYRKINQEHPRPKPDLVDAADHIDHMVRVMGVDHVGVGTDFDGGGGIHRLDDVTDLPNLTEELIRRGYTEEDIHKIWGGNCMRVLRQAQQIAAEMRAEADAAG